MRARLALLVLLATSCAGRGHPTPAVSVTEDEGPRVEEAEAPTPQPSPGGRGREAAELDLPPPPTDRGNALFSKQLDFRGGEPWVPVKLMEGQMEVTFSPRGRMRLQVPGEVEKRVEAPAGSVWRVRVRHGAPAKVRHHVQLAEHRFEDREGLAASQSEWAARGVKTRVQILGALFGIAGKVIDNRRYLVLVDEPFEDLPAAQARQAALVRAHGGRALLFEELAGQPTGALELVNAEGSVIAVGEGFIEAETLDGQPFEVRQVEYGVGYDFHGFADRTFRGGLRLAVDREGRIAVVNLVRLEDLMKGLVPSEIFASAHNEALKAQAVTARGEVLAKVGTRHLADPYLLCSEQHCAVYSGLSGEAATTNAAVDETRGQALFDEHGKLVDSVYSAICGGHTEHNENVWGGVANASLRGRPDFIEPTGKEPLPSALSRFIGAPLPAACRLSSMPKPSRYRWERRFTAAEVDALVAELGVGRVMALAVPERGVSGRARSLLISGESGAREIRGELVIRRRFRMLNSAMFEVGPEKDAATGAITHWVFRGGGWGHGVGLCQTGAIGRAEAGHDYRQILRHYFNGAEVAPIY